MRRALALTAALLLAVAACGDDDTDVADEAATGNDTTDADTTDASTTDSADAETGTGDDAGAGDADDGPDPACPAAPFEFELQLADAFGDAPEVPLGPFTFTDAVAVQVDEAGGAFTVYLADHDLDPADFRGFYEPAVGADQTLLTVFVTAFNATEPLEPLAAGDVVEGTGEFGVLTFNLIGQRGEDTYATGTSNGTLEILAVDDRYLCATIDFFDLVDQADPSSEQQKIVRGSFAAEVVLWDLAS